MTAHRCPFAAFGVYNTECRPVCDLTNLSYFFELTTGPSVIWARFDGLDVDQGAQTTAVDPYDESLTGNVTDPFAPREIGF